MRTASTRALTNISNHVTDNEIDDDDDELLPLSQVLSDDDGDFDVDESMTLDEAIAHEEQREKHRQRMLSGVFHDKENTSENNMVGVESSAKKVQRRRRRSSARFLRMSCKFDDDILEDPVNEPGLTSEQLGEIYQKAIRLNAENKINGQNTWGLNLIDNMDKIVKENESSTPLPQRESTSDASKVNFTKASCTLDASVKIYSYRVDDVHLSSYKVLANMNRTGPANSNETDNLESDDENEKSKRKTQKKVGMSSARGESTLCTNITSLNVSKLDLSYDVDPLFHKMSKEFDEGGARGLLLNNLCVSRYGCNIQFDSKQEELNIIEEEKTVYDENSKESTSNSTDCVDISMLIEKLDCMLNGQTLSSLQLLPQLEGLRQSLTDLEGEGFTNDMLPKTPKSKHYANSESAEKEAEVSIHQEALERSRISVGAAEQVGNDICFEGESDDWGGDDDDGYDSDDAAFDDFIAMNTNNSQTINHMGTFYENGNPVDVGENNTNSTSFVLEAICGANILENGSQYGYFDPSALKKMMTGNLWAGAAHWKRSTRERKKPNRLMDDVLNEASSDKKKKKLTSEKRSKKSKQISVIDFKSSISSEAFKMTTRSKRSKADPLKLSNAVKHRQSQNNHLLPCDARISISDLNNLFLVPHMSYLSLIGAKNAVQKSNEKRVDSNDDDDDGFGAFDDGDNDDYDDYGGGVTNAFGGNTGDVSYFEADDYNTNIEGVRKVEKVRVGYAQIAKKVDVKRLKKDLWLDLENRMKITPACEIVPTLDNRIHEKQEDEEENEISTDKSNTINWEKNRKISFQSVVNSLDDEQEQQEVTLPFYFICILHLANEKGLKLDSSECGLRDFLISKDDIQ